MKIKISKKKIFTITCLFLEEEEQKNKRTASCGFYYSFDTAKEIILTNSGDLFEAGFYNHAVIEEFSEGVPTFSEKEWWFKADYTNAKHWAEPQVSEIRKPIILYNICNFCF